jgi:hypothetical protein
MASRAGRWGSVTPPDEAYQLSREVKEMLEAAGSSAEAVRAAITPWARYAALDIAHDIISRYKKPIDDRAKRLQEVVTKYPQPITADDAAFLEAVERSREVVSYAATLYPTIKDATLTEYGSRLKALLDAAPSFVPAGVSRAVTH